MTLRLFVIAGEPSGDRLGAALMAGLKESAGTGIAFHGVGGPSMQAEGLRSLFPMEDLTVIGPTAILGRLRGLLARIRQTSDAAVAWNPDALVTIDIPEFSLRVAARVKARAAHIPAIHYVAPTVWAWRPRRARKMAAFIDHVLALFPFEPPHMHAEGIGCDFVGHPIAAEPQATDAERAVFRARIGAAAGAPLILALPGSRRSEVTRLAPVFGAALRPVLERHPRARVVLPAASPVAALAVEKTREWPGPVHILDPRGRPANDAAAEKRAAFGAADVALAASGTVSLELAAAETPMVIAYDGNWLSRKVVASMLKVDTVTLVNLVSGTRAVPEFLGENCRPGPIAAALNALIDAPDARQAQRDAMAAAMLRLGRGGEAPGLRAARAVLRVL